MRQQHLAAGGVAHVKGLHRVSGPAAARALIASAAAGAAAAAETEGQLAQLPLLDAPRQWVVLQQQVDKMLLSTLSSNARRTQSVTRSQQEDATYYSSCVHAEQDGFLHQEPEMMNALRPQNGAKGIPASGCAMCQRSGPAAARRPNRSPPQSRRPADAFRFVLSQICGTRLLLTAMRSTMLVIGYAHAHLLEN